MLDPVILLADPTPPPPPWFSFPDHLRLQPYSKEEKLPDAFELYFRPEKWTWTDLNVAKADIERQIQTVRRHALLP